MTSADEQRLPPSIGGLIDLAVAAYVERAPLYLGLALAAFALGWAVDLASGRIKSTDLEGINLQLAALFADAFVVAVVALGIGTRVAGERPAARTLAGGALDRWLPVLGTTTVVQLVFTLTAGSGGLGPVDDPGQLVFAPVIWLLWGALSLAGPVAALAPERAPVAILLALGRALGFGLRTGNLARLAIVALAGVVPLLLEEILGAVLLGRHLPHALFWAVLPLDALAVGPLAALQTVFALDFARRAKDAAERR